MQTAIQIMLLLGMISVQALHQEFFRTPMIPSRPLFGGFAVKFHVPKSFRIPVIPSGPSFDCYAVKFHVPTLQF